MVRKFNNEESKFANYLAEIWGAARRDPTCLRRKPVTRNRRPQVPFLRAKDFCIVKMYGYASSLLLLSHRVSLFPRVRSESTENVWLPGGSGEFPTGIKRLRSARDGG